MSECVRCGGSGMVEWRDSEGWLCREACTACEREFIGPRTAVQRYPMRGHAGRGSDWVECFRRRIGSGSYDFSRVKWAHGGVSVRAYVGGTTVLVHEWESEGER